MIKYITHKLRTQSINDNLNNSCSFTKKSDVHDSGTESDGDIDAERVHSEPEMETSMSSRLDATSPTDTACSLDSPAMMCQSHLLYDQHSSEEELEVINGPSSLAAAEAAASILVVRGTASSLISERGSSSLEPDELFGEAASTSKRSSSTMIENRKRSLAHSSDDELKNMLEPISTPVNFRTSPPLEALKPNRSHMFRSATPLILTEASRGIENIKISCDSTSSDQNGSGDGSTSSNSGNGEQSSASTSNQSSCIAALKSSCSSHHIHQPQPKYQFHYNSSRSSPASTTSGLELDVRSVSPPAKLFHCAISPRRRPMRAHHAPQRLQRPHRPCLDFDKMQQLQDRSVSSWRHNSEHTGELSVFCW
ncbi:uncharacterized protein LOC129949521 isoform X1 [Eupeodes corollae]|uniref:uncharacterized protein LOC129949521 isoform X1 n=2 Tax=Eupeodes corollae TaxID=290404 RepID=UPI0024921A05|nr:uncharacterized protein LOC129949521 isoform X1 [Eupeodes corollae]